MRYTTSYELAPSLDRGDPMGKFIEHTKYFLSMNES